MIRGILSGAVWGLVIATGGLSVASLLAPQPAGNTPPLSPQVDAPADAPGIDAPTGAAPGAAAVVAPVVAPDLTGGVSMAPQVSAPETAPDPAFADTASADQPDAGLTDAGLSAPDTGNAPDLAAGSDAPVQTNPQSVAPQVPALEQELALTTETAIPSAAPDAPVPEAELESEPLLPEQPSDPDPTGDEAATVVVAVPGISAQDQPAEAVIPEIAPDATPPAETGVEVSPAPIPTPATDPVTPQQPEGEVAQIPDESPTVDVALEPAQPEVVPEAVPDDASPAGVVAEVVPDDVAPDVGVTGEITPDPQPDPEQPTLPAVVARDGSGTALPQTDSAVRINRPGSETEVETDGDADVAGDADAADPAAALEPTGPALVRYAAAFDNPDAKPVLSVILIDEGTLDSAPIALAGLPFPVTVAIDPGMPGAASAMADYRAAGIEIMALAKLPQGAVPTDVEVTFESVFATLPDAIGVLDAGEGGLQADSAVTDQAMMRFAADGRGVVTMSEGLNMAARAAAVAGVPAGTIYRDLDSKGQDAQTIRRFLDQAAFRARQSGGVILLGRLRADTLSALILWGTQSRAGQVAVAPVSAVLLAE